MPCRCTRFGAAPAFQIEEVLVGERRRDDLDELARRRRKASEPGDAAAFGSAVAEHLELHDIVAVMDRAGPVKR
jgi:hypothetical protein